MQSKLFNSLPDGLSNQDYITEYLRAQSDLGITDLIRATDKLCKQVSELQDEIAALKRGVSIEQIRDEHILSRLKQISERPVVLDSAGSTYIDDQGNTQIHDEYREKDDQIARYVEFKNYFEVTYGNNSN